MAARYWVSPISATWDGTAGLKWSTTSGGLGGSSVPGTGDDVFLDAASGSNTVTISSTQSVQSLDCTGYAGTLAGTSTPLLNITQLVGTGVCKFASGMTLTDIAVTLGGSSGHTVNLTTAGKTIPGTLIIGNSIICGLQDDLTCAGQFKLVSGTFNSNDHGITADNFNLAASGTATLNMGAGIWTVTGAGSIWDASGGHITVNPGTSTIKLTNNSSSSKTFGAGTTATYNNFWNATQGSGVCIISGSKTFNDLKIDNGRTQQFTDGTTTTVTSLTAGSGPAAGITLQGTSTAGWTISKSSGAVAVKGCTISRSTASGGAAWNAPSSDGNVDGANNSGWNFAARAAFTRAKQLAYLRR